MISLLNSSNSNSTKAVLKNAYAIFLYNGGIKMPDFVNDREDGAILKSWAFDLLRDVIYFCIKSYYNTNPQLVSQEIYLKTKKEISIRAKKIVAKSILGIIKNEKLDEIEKSEKINKVLQGIGILKNNTYYNIKNQFYNIEITEDNLVDYIDNLILENNSLVTNVDVDLGKIAFIISQKIMGAELSLIDKEMNKWSFIESEDGDIKQNFRAFITKKKLHSVAGLNMGVCVAVDDKLWEKENFSNVVLFGDDNIARGGMHFEILEVEGLKYLTLPGINPSLLVLREISAERIFNEMILFAKKCAIAISAEAILIPTDKFIFSNREELHTIISNLNLPKIKLPSSHQFSYNPPYFWDKAYLINIE